MIYQLFDSKLLLYVAIEKIIVCMASTINVLTICAHTRIVANSPTYENTRMMETDYVNKTVEAGCIKWLLAYYYSQPPSTLG